MQKEPVVSKEEMEQLLGELNFLNEEVCSINLSIEFVGEDITLEMIKVAKSKIRKAFKQLENLSTTIEKK